MISIFIGSIFSSVILISSGVIFIKFFFGKKLINIDPWIAGIYGFITLGFFSLILNFFFPINKFIGTLFLLFSTVIFFFYFYNFKKKTELALIIIFVSVFTLIFITSANINRPDAGLYHLPFISILQENKIMLGLTNLHYRLGHTSIFQYISAIYNNYFFKIEFLNLPLASLFPLFIVFLFKKINEAFKTKNEVKIISIFFIIIFSFYSFSRYSNFGNDAPASIFFFILIISILNIKDIKHLKLNKFYNIAIISIFLITLKPSMLVVLPLPILLFLINKKKFEILKHKNSLICLVLIFSWILKNSLISGCLIFPLKETCLSNLSYYNGSVVDIASNEAEAWSKGFPDSVKKMNFVEYNSDFNWINTWFENHFNKVKEKLFPLLIFIIIFLAKNIINRSFYKNFSFQNIVNNKSVIMIIIFSFYCSIFWFLKFPVYRLGMSFLATLIIFTFIAIFISKHKTLYSRKIYITIIGVGLVLITIKNLNRIIDNYDLVYNNSPWPKIYSMNDNGSNFEKVFKKVSNGNGNFVYYYSGGQECMYSKSPCSNYNKIDLRRKNKYGYTIFYFIK